MVKVINKKLIVGLEIGNTKIVTLVGEILLDREIKVIGIGNFHSKGIKNGQINNLESLVKSIQLSIEQAEKMSNCKISSVYLALSSKHIHFQNEIGLIPISKEITKIDIENVVNVAKSVKIKDDHRILHVIPQEYDIDYQKGIKNPIGLSGIRMTSKIHLITCHNDIINNIIKSVELCGIKVDELIFSGLASSYAVSNEEERESGVCVVDIGGENMDITIYINGSLRYTKVIPYAGNIITSDIAYIFGISIDDAESIKIKYGCAIKSIIEKNEDIEITSSNDSIFTFQRKTLSEVIEARYTELFNLVKNEIINLQNQLYIYEIKNYLTSGIILTGGAAKIDGIILNAKKIFHTNIRIGKPNNISGTIDYIQEPSYSTIIGLLNYSRDIFLKKELEMKKKLSVLTIFKNLINWVKKEF